MQGYAEETNRLNYQRRASGDAWRAELGRINKQIRSIMEAIKEGMFHPGMKDEMDRSEQRKTKLTNLFADASDDTPHLLPSASAVYAKKIAALTTALNQPKERHEAGAALRTLIEKIVLTPGPARGEMFATLHGELRTVVESTEHQAIGDYKKQKLPARFARECLYRWLRGLATSDTHIR